jgi:hypothetical protein
MTSAGEPRPSVTPREPRATSLGRHKIREDLERRPATAARDEVMGLVDQELAALRDPRYQAARLEAERCLKRGRRLPTWAVEELFKRPRKEDPA